MRAAFWQVFLPLVFVFIVTGAQSLFPADRDQIPLLISDHHADHGPFMLRHLGAGPGISWDSRACMIVLDAHADTVKNNPPNIPGNHNWISPLYPIPLKSLIWINTIRGAPGDVISQFFYSSVSRWGTGDPPLNARAPSLDSLVHSELPAAAGLSLFVSIDLDFFCIENNTPVDIPLVFDTLFNLASRWQGKVIWALALSRPWLPDDKYAWELLRQSLRWFSGKSEFAPPDLTLFTVQREDTSAKARAYRETGLAVPSFYNRENEAPDDIRDLLAKLQNPAPARESAAAPR
jgi:hypothetical protein